MSSLAARRGAARAQRVLFGWVLLGSTAFALLPWYFPQNLSLWKSLPGVFGGSETSSGLMHALAHGRPWLWVAFAALAACGFAARLPPGRAQGRWLVGGAALGLVGLVGSGFAIGATGWSYGFLGA